MEIYGHLEPNKEVDYILQNPQNGEPEKVTGIFQYFQYVDGDLCAVVSYQPDKVPVELRDNAALPFSAKSIRALIAHKPETLTTWDGKREKRTYKKRKRKREAV